MKKILFSLFLLIPVFTLLVTPVAAQYNFRASEVSELKMGEVINKDYFASGEKVGLSGEVNGDAYLAGGNIDFDGTVNGDLIVAGGNIYIRGNVTEDLRVAGGNVVISGKVSGNVSALGGNITVEKDSKILGSLTTAGGNIEVNGVVGGDITAGAGQLTVANNVGGDVVIAGDEIDFSPGALVSGNVTYYGQNHIRVAPGATISGKVTQNVPPESKKSDGGANIGWNIFNFMSALVIGVFAILLGPNIVRQKSEMILKQPLQSLGIGILTLIFTPFVILLLFITVIGIPIGVALLVFSMLVVFYVKIFISMALGMKVLEHLKKKSNPYGTFLVGLVIYTLLTMIPYFGVFVSVISICMGVGAYAITDFGFYKTLREKKLV